MCHGGGGGGGGGGGALPPHPVEINIELLPSISAKTHRKKNKEKKVCSGLQVSVSLLTLME